MNQHSSINADTHESDSADDASAPKAASGEALGETSAPSRASRASARLAGQSIEIGHEPPLDLRGERQIEGARRGVNLRWLGGSVLTALTGSALLGAAIYVAIEGNTAVAALPERAASLTSPYGPSPVQRGREAARKGDLLVRADLTVAAKSNFRAPMTTRVGDRDVVRIRGFTRIATNLSQTVGLHATDIPPFNPMRLMSGEAAERVAEIETNIEDADLSLVRRDLTDLAIGPQSPALSDEEAAAQVQEELRIAQQAGRRAFAPIPAQMMLTRTLRHPGFGEVSAYAQVVDDPFHSIEVRVIPENVSVLPKVAARPSEAQFEELNFALAENKALAEHLREQGANPLHAIEAAAALGGEKGLAALPQGLAVRALVAPGPRPGDPRRILRVVLYGENGVEAIAAVDDAGVFVAVAIEEEAEETRIAERGAEAEERGGARLYESLYETALKHGLSKETVEELVSIFAYDVDFQRRVASGDSLDLFLGRDDDDPQRVEILSAALDLGGEVRRVYRFHSPEDGSIAFFDELGRSLKKFLMRTPIAEGRMTSGFGNRRHPILGYQRMHTGVDWAARTGTPIFAAGNGRVIKAAWDGGYGRRVEIQHANGYVTTYSHMTRFANGIEPGVTVTQGQVIGYVGSTGLSTGPHLHYEVLVNGRFVDPLKIRVPRSQELDGFALAEFNRQREQIVQLIDKAGGPARLAQTETR